MEHEIQYGPAYALATLTLDPGESVRAEAGAMVSMGPQLEVETSASGAGGLLKGLKRAALGGESFFMNAYTAKERTQLALAPPLPGDIVHRTLGAETVYLTSGCYLASEAAVDVDTKWGGAKTFFSREGLFLLKVTGPGYVFVSSYGAIAEIPLDDGQVHTVDSGHIVGFTDGVGYQVRKFAGWKSTFLGGEGLVVELTGPGTAWMQTRSADAFIDWIAPKLPQKNNTS
ncbi:MAG TPA: TIGR00266 family protein [Acidimicrobiia bacterium]|nr:TIGR00266 family protein [Acidimicrobiia bacterium]